VLVPLRRPPKGADSNALSMINVEDICLGFPKPMNMSTVDALNAAKVLSMIGNRMLRRVYPVIGSTTGSAIYFISPVLLLLHCPCCGGPTFCEPIVTEIFQASRTLRYLLQHSAFVAHLVIRTQFP